MTYTDPNSGLTESLRPVVSSTGAVVQFHTSAGIVYQIQAHVLPYLTGSVYLAPAEDGWVLIDSGCGDSTSNADLERGFEIVRGEFDASFKIEKIRRVVLTHAHVDHFGGVYEWSRRCGAEVWVHAFESRLVNSYDTCARVENLRYERFLLEAGVPSEDVQPILDGFGFRPGRVREAEVSRKLYGGETFGAMKFLYLPGHSSGHLAILFGDVVFSGDLLLSKTLTQIWPTRMTPQTGALNYIFSLKKLEKIAISFEARFGKKLTALPAHEEPIGDIPRRVETVLRGTERRNQRLTTVLRDSETPLSLLELTRKMYWNGRPNREFFALSDVGSRVELLLQLGLLEIVDSERLTRESPVLRYRTLFSNAETAENTVQQVLRMYLACYDSDTI